MIVWISHPLFSKAFLFAIIYHRLLHLNRNSKGYTSWLWVPAVASKLHALSRPLLRKRKREVRNNNQPVAEWLEHREPLISIDCTSRLQLRKGQEREKSIYWLETGKNGTNHWYAILSVKKKLKIGRVTNETHFNENWDAHVSLSHRRVYRWLNWWRAAGPFHCTETQNKTKTTPTKKQK